MLTSLLIAVIAVVVGGVIHRYSMHGIAYYIGHALSIGGSLMFVDTVYGYIHQCNLVSGTGIYERYSIEWYVITFVGMTIILAISWGLNSRRRKSQVDRAV